MPRPIKLYPHDRNWKLKVQKESQTIQACLKSAAIQIIHFGSTSIPDIYSKEDLDILLVVRKLEESLKLEEIGYTFKGELNVPLRYFFSKNTDYSKVNLHVCEPEHPFIDLQVKFRDYLIKHPDAAKEYSELKQKIVRENPNAHIRASGWATYYGITKNVFIKKILKKTGFNQLMVNFCLHVEEWDAYHRIKERLIFKPEGFAYNRQHPSITSDDQRHFCLYHGAEIVGMAQIELLEDKTAILRTIAIDKPYQRKGYGNFLLSFLEQWLIHHKIKMLKTHAAFEAIKFYAQCGYKKAEFITSTPPLSSNCIGMVKTLT